MSRKIERLVLVAVFLVIGFCVSAQDGTYGAYSPYSIYGIGDIAKEGTAYNKSMGGVGIATRNRKFINYTNPAAVTARDTLSFMADFGDGARSISCSTEEDEKNLSFVKFNMSKFKAYTKGYVREISSIATPEEIETLKYGPLIITIELAARFLTDYLENDVYFNTKYDEHNLIRARTQLKFVKELEQKKDELETLVSDLLVRFSDY